MKPLDSPLSEAKGEEGRELSNEMLEFLAGGKIGDYTPEEYRETLAHYKNGGWTKEQLVERFAFLGPEGQKEIAEIADMYWDTV